MIPCNLVIITRASWLHVHTILADSDMCISIWSGYPFSAFCCWHVVGNCGADINIIYWWRGNIQAVKRDIFTWTDEKSTARISWRLSLFSISNILQIWHLCRFHSVSYVGLLSNVTCVLEAAISNYLLSVDADVGIWLWGICPCMLLRPNVSETN